MVVINVMCLVGYEPYEITHASDNFQHLYDLAVDLVRRWVKRGGGPACVRPSLGPWVE